LIMASNLRLAYNMEDSLSAVITRGLGTRFIGQRVLYYPRLTSTMAMARQEAQRGAPEGTVVIADEQTAGRGRLGRAWLTPQGNIALSLVLYPNLADLPSLIMLASLAVVHSLKAVTGLKSQIKWPNDVQINGRKVCGILIETDVVKDRVNYAIIGIGLNVNLRLGDFPEIQSLATSLSQELGREVPRLSVIRSLLVELEKLYLTLKAGGSLYEEWRDSLVTLGQRIRVKSAEGLYEGMAESVDRDGSLLLRGAHGQLTKIIAGDVTLCD
jgi:BirA family biotin operon repressor/biotin-[acetyl-CoA-carboxylase] ligase